MLARNPILSECPLFEVWLNYITLDTACIPVALNSFDSKMSIVGAVGD